MKNTKVIWICLLLILSFNTSIKAQNEQLLSKDKIKPDFGMKLPRYSPPKDIHYKPQNPGYIRDFNTSTLSPLVVDSTIELPAQSNFMGLFNQNNFFIDEALQKSFSELNLVSNPSRFPQSTNVRIHLVLKDGRTTHCSGTLIQDRYLITAAHCLYDKDDGGYFIERMEAQPGYHDGQINRIHGTAKVTKWYISPHWIENSDWGHDYLICMLDRPLGYIAGSFEVGYNTDDRYFLSSLFNNYSYPGEDYGGKSLYHRTGKFDLFRNKDIVVHNEYSRGGQSGSSAYVASQDGSRTVYAILSHGNGEITPDDNYTGYTRLTEEKVLNVKNFINQTRPTNPDLTPLYTHISNTPQNNGQVIDTLGFFTYNYGGNNYRGNLRYKIYFSTDRTINSSDTEVASGTFNNFELSSYRLNPVNVLNVPISAQWRNRNYYVGILLDINDADNTNNWTSTWDVVAVNASSVACNDTYEPNGSISNANATAFPTTLASSSYTKTIDAKIGATSDLDLFKITTENTGTLKISLNNLPEDYDLLLLDDEGVEIDESSNANDDSEEIIYEVTSRNRQSFFIQIEGYEEAFDCSQSYNLKIEWTPKSTSTLSVTPNNLNFTASAETKPINVTSNTTWSISESLSWLSVSPISGSNNGTVNISCTANTSTSSRTGTITVSGSGVADQRITVTQNGASVVACSAPSNVHLVQKGYSWFYIEWDAVPNITTYSFRYRKQSETTWITNDAWGFDDLIYSIQSPCTDYVFQVRTVCGNNSFSDWSPELKIKTDGCNEAYCYSYGISYEDWIKEVSFAGIKNTSSSNYGYINLTNTTSAQVEVGKSYPLGLSAGFSNESNGDTYYWQVWIDFNQDNDFSDAGELVFSSTSSKASSVAGLSKDILIPTSAKAGKTRMRVAMSLQSGESPCTTTETGRYLREIEDYSVEIAAVSKTLALSPNTLNFDAGSSSKTITITSNTTWSIAESLSWLSVSPISGSNNGTVNISCTANTSTSSRTGTITVSGSGVADQKITVTQAGVSSACIGPKNIRNTYIEYAAFWVAWDTVPGVKAYNTRMKPTNSTQWQEIRRTYPVAIYWNVPPNTRYEFQIQSVCSNGNSDWSPSFFTTTLGAGDPYCFSYGDSDYGDIDGFKLGTTTFNSPLSQGFGNYTEQSAPVETGKSYDVELSARDWLSNGTKPAYWRIWIDFNRDNDYNDSGELVFESLGNNISKTTGKITIPSNVTAGKTRIRIALDLDAQNGPCSTGGRREVEDYSIEIKAANPTANLSVSPSSLAFTAANESKSFTITSNTAWTITESLSWLRVSATSGSNNSTITVTCDANTTTTTRTGTISISGTGVSTQSISITQAAGSATLSVSPLNLSFGAPGGNQTFSIKSNLAWSVSESLDWLSVTPNSGSNDGQVAITCANNPQITNRTGSITVTAPGVSSQTITVTQTGVAPVVNVSPTTLNFTANGGSQSFNISANTNWTASESQDWLSLSPASGNNNASIAVTCSPNTSTSTRTGVIIISGTAQTVTVTQSGAAPAVCRAPSNLRNQITPDNPTNSISYSWFFVYWDAVPGATGYSARLRPVGSTSWREIKDVAVNQVDFRNLQPNTNFEVQVQSFCADGSASAWSSSLTTKTLGEGDPYCASYGDHQFGDINTVLLAGNALGGGFSQGYSFFKDKVYPLEKGRNYRLELVADDWQKSGEKPAYWRIWIDFNQDNDFNDPNELVFEAEGKNTGRVAGDLTLGTNPSTGKTRMRIALDMDGQNGPCSTKGNRDVEDYLVEIRNPGDVWNEVVQTDQSHIIVLSKDIKSDIEGSVLQEGDQIGVFYTEKGLDYCAGKVKWTGNNTAITVYGDDLSSPQKDGFAAQEKFQIKVWQAQTGNEYKLDASYAPLGTYGITNAQGQFVNDGVSVVLSLGQNLPVATQEIPLQVGWNTISAYLAPKSTHLDSILQSIRPSLQLFKNAAGKSFIFSPAINDIGAWNSTEGYRIKVTKPETLRLSGQMIDPSLAVVPIRSGWQIIPYYGQQAVAIETALNSIRDKVVIVKNNAGAVYIPGELAINTIGNLEPGQGYLLKANADGQLRYSSSGLKPVPDLRNEGIPQHFLLPSNYNTGQNSTLIFPKALLVKTLELNDEIGVFSPSGYLCGAARFTGNHLAISVWGDDATTAGVQGIQTNEAYTLQVWSNAQQKELPLRSSLSSLTYRENDVVLVQTLQVAISTHTLEEKLIPTSVVLSPNPTDTRVQLYFTQNLSGKVNIRILALDGKILQQHDYPQGLFKGQSTALDLSRLPRGMYQVQLRSASGWWTGKVSVMRH